MATNIGANLMAPVLPRHFHQFPSPPRPPKDVPATPVPVSKYISLKVFFELFAGTICIFVLGVLFWRLGRCLRRFTRGKVLKKGKTTGMRYVRTWYGWIPLQQHEEAKNVFRNCWAKICEWTAWKSTRADYSWVWWDPDQKGHEAHRQKKKHFRLLPEFLRSKSFTTADTIWNRGVPRGQNANTLSGHQPVTEIPRETPCQTPGERSEMSENINTSEPRFRQRIHGFPAASFVNGFPSCEGAIHNSFPRRQDLLANRPHLPLRKAKLFWSLDQSMQNPREIALFLDGHGSDSVPQQVDSPPGRLSANAYPQRRRQKSCVTLKSCDTYSSSRALRGLRYSRKYQVWAAKMQLHGPNQLKYNQGGLQEPPGTPTTDVLVSYELENSTPFGSFGKRQGQIDQNFSGRSSQGLSSIRYHHPIERAMTAKSLNNKGLEASQWHTMPPTGGVPQQPSSSRDVFAQKCFSSSFRDLRCGNTAPPSERPMLSGTRAAKGKWPEKIHHRLSKPKRSPIPFQDLSDWEIRWVDNVDRKLEWHVDQLTPGRRPFHFPLLANHWLNKRTWLVLDPPSRVPVEDQRQRGDPRFNVPYPAPRWEAKTTYQAVGHNIPHTPRIDSWRVAVNCQRRESGIRGVIRTVRLFDDSIDEPPDGMVDPASWILRKPPQGLAASSKQGSTYYEGGAGWQEKFRDWQTVRHGYRIRKTVYEGRVNRTRVKELVTGMSRPFRTAASKALGKFQH